MKLVGLTGGIACGKTTFSSLLLQAGIPVIDADLIAHQVVSKVVGPELPFGMLAAVHRVAAQTTTCTAPAPA